jgi:hypothetical protein
MNTDNSPRGAEPSQTTRKPLSEAAKRALAEAAARNAAPQAAGEKEYNGRQGPDPVRYGDWEVKGLASDF